MQTRKQHGLLEKVTASRTEQMLIEILKGSLAVSRFRCCWFPLELVHASDEEDNRSVEGRSFSVQRKQNCTKH